MKKWVKRISVSAGAVFLAIVAGISAAAYLIFLLPLEDPHKNSAPLLFYNGNIITVDPSKPRAEAVLVSGETIRFVGGYREALAMAPENTIKIDLKGKTLVPGFNDNHVHSLAAGTFYSELMLWNLSCGEIAERVGKEAAGRKKGEPIYGNLWDYTTCKNPDRALLDRAAPDNPVFLMQYSGHAAWVNSYQLREMKIGRDTPDPAGGQIVRDAKGEPTGILRDTAMGSVPDDKYLKIVLDSARHRKTIATILDLYRKAGITSVQDNTWVPFTARLYRQMRADDELTCRISSWSQGGTAFYHLFNMLTSFREKDPWLHYDTVKYFADGAFSTRTAWLKEPYNDEPKNCGKPRYTPAELDAIILEAAGERKRLAIHAIGDRAVAGVLDSMEKAQAKYPWTRDLRFRIEHCQLVDRKDIPRMKRLGAVACVQPFALCTPAKDALLLGDRRARAAYPYKSLLDAGVPVSFGSDAPAEVDYAPLLGIYYAVTRKDKAGRLGPLNGAECFTPYEALYAYTMGSAYAEKMEDKKGSITAGKLSDMAVLSDDILAVPRERIKDVRVLMTVVAGTIVYGRPTDL
ncbi:MAG TPA: amidohydrolase [Spirochaetota bacterium]|nr:amidohydrolase [Spirochaetota bacterium]HPC40906.1 amidohydrolase [Spirochaetota bacterium]HPL16033.1 amidohydrolase [Spirochaetota bacterium]HQF08664.1 amidohydrolase [Spirochaetota bacterium]HQH97379.1 amidohydrolase [Spirochaetota bacterium]